MSIAAAIKALFPRGRLFRFLVDRSLTRLVAAIGVLPVDVRNEIELAYMDIFPESSRSIDIWTQVFGVIFDNPEFSSHRATIAALWDNRGGQSAYLIQRLLSFINPEIRVIENNPPRVPRGSSFAYKSVNGASIMVCGNQKAINSFIVGDVTFEPTVLRNGTDSVYDIPDDPKFWESCFYVCRDVELNVNHEIIYVSKITMPIIYKKYVEYLILRIKPAHTQAVMHVEWSE